jgi:hypothetical protein
MAEMELSAALQPVLALELARGNRIARTDVKVWTDCAYGLVMSQPLHVNDIAKELRLPNTVKYWECHDTHYELQAGYYDEVARHSIAGPLKE